MNKNKICLTVSIGWIIAIGYLTWFNGLKKKGTYLGFNWEEWFWFGLIPLISIYLFYFIWNPDSFKRLIKDIKELF